MPALDKFFPTGVSPTAHPKLRMWGPLLENSSSNAACEVLRKFDGFGYSPAKLFLHWKDQATGEQRSDGEDWDDTLNAYLVEHGIRAVTVENEATRFDLMLEKLFRPLEIRFGEGYFNAVLFAVVNSSFGDLDRIKSILAKIGELRPHQGKSYLDNVEKIEVVIQQCAVSLSRSLHYERNVSEKILAEAVALYMEDRFSLKSLWMRDEE